MRSRLRVRDGWWLVVAIAFASLLVLNAVGAVAIAVRGPRSLLLWIPATFLVDYWFMMGAWLRTSWGRPGPDSRVPPGPPALSARRSVTLILIAATCVVAVAVAVAIQLHDAR